MIDINQRIPLSERMRPKTIDQFLGQSHIVGQNMLLRRAILAGMVPSCIFYGPPGVGKTTLARIIAGACKGKFEQLNAVSSGVADAKKIIEEAKKEKSLFGVQTYLLLDECHRWSKAQSDCILSAVEEGSIIFIGSTTENPYTSMTRAIVSRCKIFEFKPLQKCDIVKAINNALLDKENGYGNIDIDIDDKAIEQIWWASGGDVRSALNSLELAVKSTPKNEQGKIVIDVTIAEQSTQTKAMSLNEDLFYDILSAFCKSLRGSDADAALYYMQRLIQGGVDPRIIARRLIAHASEDVGMADSNALLMACMASYSCDHVGVPECLLTLSHAVIYICEAEKSNSVYIAMSRAEDDAKNNKDDNIPFYLLNHPATLDKKKIKYKYPHDFGGYCKQQYFPDSLKDRIYYEPKSNGKEKNMVRKKFIGDKK